MSPHFRQSNTVHTPRCTNTPTLPSRRGGAVMASPGAREGVILIPNTRPSTGTVSPSAKPTVLDTRGQQCPAQPQRQVQAVKTWQIYFGPFSAGCSALSSKCALQALVPHQGPQYQHMQLSEPLDTNKRKPGQIRTIKHPKCGQLGCKDG